MPRERIPEEQSDDLNSGPLLQIERIESSLCNNLNLSFIRMRVTSEYVLMTSTLAELLENPR